MVCPKEKKIVPSDEIVRGYETAPDRYVPITDEELESVAPERSRTIEIVRFIDMKEVDSVYYGHPYYLVPSKGGEKAYRLLAEAMRRTNKAGLARFVLGEREHLAAVRSLQGALCLTTLHYGADVIPDKPLLPKHDEVNSRETNRMRRIIKGMAADFNPDKYSDERRERIMKLLEKKAKEEGVVEAPEVEEDEAEGPVDLVAVLEKSMRRAKKKR
jgi:DNA end-binding protein Ku